MRLTVACPYIVLFGLVALATSWSTAHAETSKIAAPPKYVTFDGQRLNLAWQNENPELPIAEFIPEGETLEKWTQLASIRRFPEQDDAQALAQRTVEGVAEQYPGAPTNLQNNPDGSDAVIEFIVSPPDDAFAEYNLFRYAHDPAGGVVAEQYALRGYGDRQEFLDSLTERRQRLLDEMAASGLERPEEKTEKK